MATKQLDDDDETPEEAAKRIKAEADAKREAASNHSPFPCQHCGYGGPAKTDLNSHTALKGLALEALVQIVETAPRNVSLVTAIRELIDRVEGKAPQSIAMTVKKSPESTLSDDQLAALLALLPNAVVIPPMPRRLENE